MSLKLSSIINFSGLAADAAEWKRVAKIVFLVTAIPLLIMFLLCEYVGWNLGEDVSPEEVAKLQAADPTTLWEGSSFASHYRLKLARLEEIKPDIMVIGESRAGNLRSEMFQPYSCYNMFRSSYPIQVYTEMLNRIPKNYSPKVIIFNLDFFLFNEEYAKYYYKEASPNAEKIGLHDHINMIRKSFLAITRNPLVLFASRQHSLHNVPALGLMPHVHGEGYRADGSIIGWVDMPQPRPDPYATAKWNNDPAYDYCDAMSPTELAHLEEFVKAAHARGIALVGVQMPLYGPVLHRFETDPHFGILQDYRKHLADGYFDRLGILVFDYSNFPPFSPDPRYFTDAVHGTEVVTANVVLKMAADPRFKQLLPNLDVSDLQKRVDEANRDGEYGSLYHN